MRYDFTKVEGMTFNHRGQAWVYDDSIMPLIEDFMDYMEISDRMLWKDYL